MGKFRGNLTGTLHDSPQARDHYERHALKHSMNALEVYETMNPAKRKRIDHALDAIAAEALGVPTIDEFVALHPAAEIEQNALAMRRYFTDRGIQPPYRLFELEQAWEELKNDDVLVFSTGQQAAKEWESSQRMATHQE